MNRSKTVAGSDVREHDTKFSKSRCLEDNIQKFNHNTKQALKPQFSIQNDTIEAASTSKSVLLPFTTELIDGENSTGRSSESNVATNLMEKSTKHSRYCCDNIPVA